MVKKDEYPFSVNVESNNTSSYELKKKAKNLFTSVYTEGIYVNDSYLEAVNL